MSNLFFRLFPGINNLMIVKIGRLHFGHNCLPVHLKCINLSESDILTIHQMATSIITFSSVQKHRTLDRNYIRKLSAYNFPLLWELLTKIFQNQQPYFSWKSSNIIVKLQKFNEDNREERQIYFSWSLELLHRNSSRVVLCFLYLSSI